jgi:hypothetical protein
MSIYLPNMPEPFGWTRARWFTELSVLWIVMSAIWILMNGVGALVEMVR